MSTVFNPTITAAGKAAAINAGNTGVALALTHVAFGTGAYNPTGNESGMAAEIVRVAFGGGTRITPTQVRLQAIWQSDAPGIHGVTEIGLFAGSTLVAVWSTAAGEPKGYKTPGVDYVFFYDVVFASLPANSLTVQVDSGQSAILAAHASHLNSPDPHPQYMTSEEVSSAISAHLSDSDPHPNYTTAAEVSAAIAEHALTDDPHPQYMTQSEVDARIGALAGPALTKIATYTRAQTSYLGSYWPINVSIPVSQLTITRPAAGAIGPIGGLTGATIVVKSTVNYFWYMTTAAGYTSLQNYVSNTPYVRAIGNNPSANTLEHSVTATNQGFHPDTITLDYYSL